MRKQASERVSRRRWQPERGGERESFGITGESCDGLAIAQFFIILTTTDSVTDVQNNSVLRTVNYPAQRILA